MLANSADGPLMTWMQATAAFGRGSLTSVFRGGLFAKADRQKTTPSKKIKIV